MAAFNPFQTPKVQWVNLTGTYGEFNSPGSESRLSYVLTYASLAQSGSANARLTKDLLPVRELLDVGKLNFNELLQRDLDDHRVATEIIPYILKHNHLVRFFPPILAIVVPVKGQSVEDHYPSASIEEEQQDGYLNEVTTWGSVLQLTRARQGSDYSDQVQLGFNPDRTKMLVIDGQHRAMAMLAIRRSLTGDWGDRGRDFMHFYEDLAQGLKNTQLLSSLESIQLPVCICYFPDLVESGNKPYSAIQACRKLFLDVNKNARTPSKSRIILLDDSDIQSILSRALLAKVRAQGQIRGPTTYGLDLECFEYDSPSDSPNPKRDLAFATIQMLRDIVFWTVFSSEGFHNGFKLSPSAGRRKLNVSRFLKEIQADELIPMATIQSWEMSDLDQDLDPSQVPASAHSLLGELFLARWGQIIIDTFESLRPFEAHHQAVTDLRAGHQTETGHGRLAYRAMFEGQGVFWTIQSYAETRGERRKELKKIGGDLPTLEIEKAYKAITEQWLPKEFQPARAMRLFELKDLDAVESRHVSSTNTSFIVFQTLAFQIGLFMTFSYLKEKLELRNPDSIQSAVQSWINAWNEVFSRKVNGQPRGAHTYDRDHRDEQKNPQGLFATHIGRLQVGEWVWFRYFTLEQLAASSMEFAGRAEVEAALPTLRKKYLTSFAGRLRSRADQLGEVLTLAQAKDRAQQRWEEALKYSFGVTKAAFRQSLEEAVDDEVEVADRSDVDDYADEE